MIIFLLFLSAYGQIISPSSITIQGHLLAVNTSSLSGQCAFCEVQQTFAQQLSVQTATFEELSVNELFSQHIQSENLIISSKFQPESQRYLKSKALLLKNDFDILKLQNNYIEMTLACQGLIRVKLDDQIAYQGWCDSQAYVQLYVGKQPKSLTFEGDLDVNFAEIFSF